MPFELVARCDTCESAAERSSFDGAHPEIISDPTTVDRTIKTVMLFNSGMPDPNAW